MVDAMSEVTQLTMELLEVPSVTRDEGRIADHLEEKIGALQPHALVRAANSLCFAMREPDPDRPTLMLVGHTDTVPEIEPNPVRVEGDRLYGLGASDMKAADALILHALFRSAQEAPRHNLVGVLYAAEESAYEHSEMPLIYEAARAWFDRTDLAICMEPTDNRIELGCLGTSHIEVTFCGKRAHSARPWHGENAIHKAADLLMRLAERKPTVHQYHGLEFTESLSATMIDYRGARNVIPDRCVVNVNFRFAPGKSLEDVRAEIESMLGGAADFEVVDFCPSGTVCADNSLVVELTQALPDAEVRAKQAWTDVGRLSQLGVDAINWGPGAISQAHQAGEWVSLADVRRALVTLDHWQFGG